MLDRSRCTALLVLLAACDGAGRTLPTTPVTPVTPAAQPAAGTSGAPMLRLAAVQFTQAIQDESGALPLVAGRAAAVNVRIQADAARTEGVPVVLRLFRNGALIHADTVRTDGDTGQDSDDAEPNAQFLVPATLVESGVSWQVELDPARTRADATHDDNLLPGRTPAALTVVTLPPLAVTLVPIVLGAHDGATGNVSTANAAQYLQAVQQSMPVGALTHAVAPPMTTMASFGTTQAGGTGQFWLSVLQELDIARLVSPNPGAYWYGVVTPPAGFTKFVSGGYGYVPRDPADAGSGSRTAIGFGISDVASPAYVSKTVAHELGHLFGRAHAPSCSASAPLDTRFPSTQGSILTTGYDVWSWASGRTRGARAVSRSTGDVMGYCSDVWTSAYTWSAVLRWRQAGGAVSPRTTRVPAILVAGSIAADGTVSLRPALQTDVTAPPAAISGDVTVTLADAAGATLARVSAVASRVDHGDGARHFVAVLPAATAPVARVITATTSDGHVASLRDQGDEAAVSVRTLADGRTDVASTSGRAVMLRAADSGALLAIGWNGRATVRHRGAVAVTVSAGVHSRTSVVQPK